MATEYPIQTLLETMKKYPDIDVIQERALRILLHCSTLEQTRSRLVELGVTPWVNRAMSRLSSCESIVRYGSEVLKNLNVPIDLDAVVPGDREQ